MVQAVAALLTCDISLLVIVSLNKRGFVYIDSEVSKKPTSWFNKEGVSGT